MMSLKTFHSLLVAQGIELDYDLSLRYLLPSNTHHSYEDAIHMVIFQQFETSSENLNSTFHNYVSNHSKLSPASRDPAS